MLSYSLTPSVPTSKLRKRGYLGEDYENRSENRKISSAQQHINRQSECKIWTALDMPHL